VISDLRYLRQAVDVCMHTIVSCILAVLMISDLRYLRQAVDGCMHTIVSCILTVDECIVQTFFY